MAVPNGYVTAGFSMTSSGLTGAAPRVLVDLTFAAASVCGDRGPAATMMTIMTRVTDDTTVDGLKHICFMTVAEIELQTFSHLSRTLMSPYSTFLKSKVPLDELSALLTSVGN